MVFLNFLNFFAIFFEFCIMMGLERNGTERKFLFSLVLILFHPIFASKEITTVFYNFLIFFCYFFGISIALQVRTKQNDNFYFLSFSTLSNLFWLEMTPYWFYDNFLIFFAISLEFSITCRVGTERNGTERNDNNYFLSFSYFSNLRWLETKP